MGYSNGKITKPLSIADESKAVGAALNDVGRLSITSKINGYARFRPVIYAKIGELTYRERVAANGMRYPDGTAAPYQFATPLEVLNHAGDYAEWIVTDKPAGGMAQAFRMTDYNGYNHKAIWHSFTNIEAEDLPAAIEKYGSAELGISSVLSKDKKFCNVILSAITDASMTATGVKDTACKINFIHEGGSTLKNDSIIWWEQDCVAANLRPVAMVWPLGMNDDINISSVKNSASVYKCISGYMFSRTGDDPTKWRGSIELNDSDLGATSATQAYKYCFLIGLFPTGTTFPNGKIPSGVKFRLPPMQKIETNKLPAAATNKAFAMWGGVIERRDLRTFYIRNVQCTSVWLTRPDLMGGNMFGTFAENMVQYQQPYYYGNSPAQFTMYTNAGLSDGTGSMATIIRKTYAWKRLVIEVTLGNPSGSGINYSHFKVSCDNRTEYVASVANLSTDSSNRYPQQCGDGNNVDLGPSLGSVSVSAMEDVHLILDLGYIIDSHYTLGTNYYAPAIGTSGNPFVTSQPGSESNGQKTITITATKRIGSNSVGSTVTLGKFILNLKYA